MKEIIKKSLRVLGKILKWSFIIVILVFLILFIVWKVPAVHDYAVQKGTEFFNNKTGGKLSIGEVDLRLPFFIGLEEINLDTPKGEKLASIGKLEIYPGWRMLVKKTLRVDRIDIEEVDAQILLNENGEWNFDFIAQGFSDSTSPPPPPQDTSSVGWSFLLGDLNLKEVSFIYADQSSGDSVNVALGSLEMEMEEINPAEQIFLVDQIELSDNEIYLRFPAGSADESEEETEGVLPTLGLEILEIDQTHLIMEMGETMPYEFEVGRLFAEIKDINIGAGIFGINQISLEEAELTIPLSDSSVNENEGATSSAEASSLFAPIEASVKELRISGLGLRAGTRDKTVHRLSDLEIDASDISANDSSYAILLEHLSGKYNEFEGLSDFKGDFSLNEKAINAKAIELVYSESYLSMSTSISFSDIQSFLDEMIFETASIDVENFLIARKDLEEITSKLSLDSIPLPRSDVEMKLMASGSFQNLSVSSMAFQTGGSSVRLSSDTKGQELWPRDIELKKLLISLDRIDLLPFSEYLGLDESMIPSKTTLGLSGKYLSRELAMEGLFSTDYGNVLLEAEGDGWKSECMKLDLSLRSDSLDVGSFLGLGSEFYSDLDFEANTPDLTDSNLTLCSNLSIDTLHYGGNGYANIRLDADLLDNSLIYTLAVEDTFVNAALGGGIELEDSLTATAEGRLYGIDLQELNYFGTDVRGGLSYYAHFIKDSLSMDLMTELNDILFVKSGDRYPISPILARYHASTDTTSAELNSGFVKFNSVSNRSLDSINTAITDLFSRSKKEGLKDTSAYWKANLLIEDLSDIQELFLPDLRAFEPSSAEIDFSARENKFIIQALFPEVEYGKYVLDSLSIFTETTGTDVIRNLQINRLAYDTLAITDVDVDLNRAEDGVLFRLSINPDTTDNHYLLSALLAPDSIDDSYDMIIRDSLVLHSQNWSYCEDCGMNLSSEGIRFETFEFYQEDRSFSLLKENSRSPFIMEARNFPLETFAGIIMTKKDLIAGDLDGKVSLNQDGTFEGEGEISELIVSGAEFGRLTWNASKENGRFKTGIESIGEPAEIFVKGTITPESDTSSVLSLDLNIPKFDLKALDEILSSQIDTASGTLTADITIRGTSTQPEIQGSFGFDDVRLRPLGSRETYAITRQAIKIEPDRLDLNGFTMKDGNGHDLVVGGYITHDNFSSPKLDITINSNDFMLADIGKEAKQSVYGTLVADLDLKVKGKPESPLVQAFVRIEEPTDFSYIVTETADREAFDETLLIWTDFEEQKSESEILTRNKETEERVGNIFANNPRIRGTLQIDESAIFQVVIDSSAGDYLKIMGKGKLDLDYDRTGALRFNGIYEVADGFYQMTFYNIAKKKFEFRRGSRIVWNGEPTNARIDISAIYRTRAGIANLMLTDPSAAYEESFQQQLPFIIEMGIKGKLMDPEIYFDILLDESAEGALSGSVEARLQDLRRDENELNKQVFTLLVLGAFIPQSGSSDANILANQARNSASQILTNQLNSLSDKYVKGVDINVDLYSYGGAAGEGNTDLNINVAKSFANNRMTVKVGSTIALEDQNSSGAQATQNQFLTNIELEYKLTPDGRYRLMVFSKTDLEDIVIGRITRSGGGFVFQRDFDRFRHLFAPPTEEEIKRSEDIELEEEEPNGEGE